MVLKKLFRIHLELVLKKLCFIKVLCWCSCSVKTVNEFSVLFPPFNSVKKSF